MKKSKKILLAILLCMPLFYGCSDEQHEIGGESETPELSAVANLIEKAGRINTLPSKKEVTIISEEKADTPEYGTLPDGSDVMGYAVKRTERYSVVDNPMEFVTLDPWDILWPGALVQGKSLMGGVPAGIPIYSKRRPGKIYLSVVSGNSEMDEWYKEVPMSGAHVTQAMNELLSKHLNANPARTAYEIEAVSSTEQMALKLGVNLKLWGSKLDQSFGNSWNKEKSYVAVKLNQIFFTMAYEGADGGFKGAFTDDITAADLKNFTGPDNPICYVNSVSYGRSYIMLYESSASRDSLLLSVTAAFGKQSVSTDLKRVKIFNEAKCKMVQIGGDPVAGLETVFGDYNKLQDFIVKGAVVSSTNIGVPISYKLSHLVDNSTVRLSNTLEYDFTSQLFLPLKPENTVAIDFFDVRMSAPASKRNVSNHSNMILKKVYAYKYEVGEEAIAKRIPIVSSPINMSIKDTGANIPIYKSAIFQYVPMTSRIRIECEFYVKNQTYKGSTHKDEGTFRLVQDLEFDVQNNAWRAVEETTNPFTQLSIHKDDFGSASMDFQLNYRFACDGLKYPLNYK